MAVGGSVIWNLDAESKGFDSKIKKASKDAKDFGHELNSIKIDGVLNKAGDAIGKIGSALFDIGKKATVALGAGTVAATGFAVKSAASFEQTRIGLENMLGSADVARSVLKEVGDFAASTPFEFPELAGSVKQLVAFGFSGSDAIKTMKELGDVSAAIGAPIGDLSYLMGTLKTQGRAFTIDIRQFAQRGVPIYEYLAKVLKTNEQAITEMIEAGKIGFPEVQKAFEAMTAEGGKFHGAMAKQSKSLSGLFSTLKDNIGQTARELVGISQTGDIRAGSLFDNLRKGTAVLIENLPKVISKMQELINGILPQLKQWGDNILDVASKISDHLGPKLEALWNTLGTKVVPMLVRFWNEVLKPLVPVIGTILVGAIGLLIDALNLWYAAITPVYNFLLDNKAATVMLAAAFGYLALVMNFNAIASGFTTAMATVRTAVGATQAMILAPLAMPAIAVAAALASLGLVISAIEKINGALSAMNNTAESVRKAGESQDYFNKQVTEGYKAGTISKENYQRYFQSTGNNAMGTDNWRGGPTWVGERGPEIVNLPKGSSVTPNHEIGSKSEYNIGTINISSEVDGEKWLKKLTRDQEIASNGLVPSRGAY